LACFLWSFGCPFFVYSGARNALDSIKIITIHSTHQKIVDRTVVLLEGDVEILLDYKLHILADHVVLDKKKQTIIATTGKGGGFVKLENPDFIMLADYVELQLALRTGCAKNIKIHVKEGFLSAANAEKVDEQTWKMEGLTYTSCDHTTPHWSFTTSQAILYKNSLLKASGLLFKINSIPIFAFPALVFPLQNRAGSGFLMPRLSFDAELGFGFRQEYYWFIGSNCDTTVGFHLVQKKGFIISDEFRWAQSPENFVIIDSHYAKEWDAWLERKGHIVRATDTRYWVQGKYFQPFSMGPLNFQSLIRFDFGTDKRLGYQFLNDAQLVEDSFCNSVIQRYRDKKHIMQFVMRSERSLRKQFASCIDSHKLEKKKEREEKVSVTYLPHYEWSTGHYELLPHLFYRHDLLFDHAFLESRNVEKSYSGTLVDKTVTTTPNIDSDTSRFMYKGYFHSSWKFFDQHLKWFIEPQLHLRSNIRKNYASNAHYKIFAQGGVEWSFPERMLYSKNYRYIHYMQPLIRWHYLPKFYQNHWHYIDKLDRYYPQNMLEFVLRNNLKLDQFYIDLLISQGYDFYHRSEIFQLRRGYGQKHLAPFMVHARGGYKGFNVSLVQEYDWRTFALAHLEVMASLSQENYDFFVGYLYQKKVLRRERELFSDIPTFAIIGCSVPLGKSLRFHYNGKFYSKDERAFPPCNASKPMLHHVRLDYEGHCWGISFGWEEKRYRQYGNWKSERAITLAIRLESIGSFAQKFKRLPMYHAPVGYD